MKMKIKTNLIKSLLLTPFMLILFSGCSFINGIFSQQNEPKQPPQWNEVKSILKNDVITADSFNNIFEYQLNSYEIKSDEIDELINIYNSTKYERTKKIILQSINGRFSQVTNSNTSRDISEELKAIISNTKLFNFYLEIAKSNKSKLASLALRGLIDREGGSDSPKWQDWSWSSEVANLLENVVNNNLYSLSKLGYYELLLLTNKYPDSLFTKGCKEYVSFSSGTYFYGLDNSTGYSIFRQPFTPLKELGLWDKFVNKYPGHPSSDDALYRLARAYEMQGDYENAILNYYKAWQAPDGTLMSVAGERILFIMDLLMSRSQLEQFTNKYPEHPLKPYFTYTKAVSLIREYKYSQAESELNKFLEISKITQDKNFLQTLSGLDKPYIDSNFWENVKKQINEVKQLVAIQNKQPGDKALYEEAGYWIDREGKPEILTAYNYLWEKTKMSTFSRFTPGKWEQSSYDRYLITNEFFQNSNANYALQIGNLKSINFLQKLLKDYPNSELASKAKYSIGVAYYYLDWSKYHDFSAGAISWDKMAVSSFEEFVRDYPNSSMADDALYTIAYLKERNTNIVSQYSAYEALQKILNDYPNGDVKKKAEEMMKRIAPQGED